MKIKTSKLTGAALDWAVAKAEGILDRIELEQVNGVWSVAIPDLGCSFEPSTCWTQGGPIIEREKIDLFTEKGTPESWVASVARYQNGAKLVGWRRHQYGPTPLIAAMRCYVASKLGDEVDVPEELK